jgi:hypothetical protein
MGLSIWYGLKMYWSSRESHLIKVLYRDGAFYFITIAGMFTPVHERNQALIIVIQ